MNQKKWGSMKKKGGGSKKTMRLQAIGDYRHVSNTEHLKGTKKICKCHLYANANYNEQYSASSAAVYMFPKRSLGS